MSWAKGAKGGKPEGTWTRPSTCSNGPRACRGNKNKPTRSPSGLPPVSFDALSSSSTRLQVADYGGRSLDVHFPRAAVQRFPNNILFEILMPKSDVLSDSSLEGQEHKGGARGASNKIQACAIPPSRPAAHANGGTKLQPSPLFRRSVARKLFARMLICGREGVFRGL